MMACVRLDDKMCSGVVRCGTRPSSRVRAPAPPVQHFLRGGLRLGLRARRIMENKGVMDALVHLRKKTGAMWSGVRGGETSG